MRKHTILSCCAIALMGISAVAQTQAPVTTTQGGTANTVPMFTSSSNVENSVITESDGNVGIGMTAPPQALSVGGYGYFYQYGGDISLFLGKGDAEVVNKNWGIMNTGQLTENRLATGNSSGTGGLSGFSEFMTLSSSGFVGIGTIHPGYTLSVNGYIEASKSDPHVGGAIVLDNPAKTTAGAASS